MAFPQTVRWINEILNNLSQVRLFLVPSGGVILWHGASNAVPKGCLLYTSDAADEL